MISGIVTGILLLAFLGITAWAWSARTQPRFREAEQLPLRDEPQWGPASMGSDAIASIASDPIDSGKERP
jgi:cytochrome c oxidase cbb3-type subunit IV